MSKNCPSTVILVDSLTNDFIGTGAQYESNRVHVGRDEARRVLGSAKDKWGGPLSVFLRQAVAARVAGRPVHIMNVRDLHDPDDPKQQPELLRHGYHNIIGQSGAEMVPPVAEILAGTDIQNLDVTSLSIPIKTLRDAVMRATGVDLLSDEESLARLTIGVVGTHSNIRIYSTANTLRNALGFPHVFVCPHLAASPLPEAHRATFARDCPNALVRVGQSVAEISALLGIDPPRSEVITWNESCKIAPEEFSENLSADQKAILETIFMDMDSVDVVNLKGGYSGSLLLLATPQRSGVRMQSVVIKIDKHSQIMREIAGYEKVKSILGNHVPSVSAPVSMGDLTGVKIALASLKGAPHTFQSMFEDEAMDVSHLEHLLEEILSTLVLSLYRNTSKKACFNPIQQFGLDSEEQRDWLRSNIESITGASSGDAHLVMAGDLEIENPVGAFASLDVSREEESLICISHRDMNFANNIVDDNNNFWFIDWTHTGEDAIEIDFAKMENEIKFVMSKEFSEADLKRLEELERLLLSAIALPDLEKLTEEFDFIQKDRRFLKIYKLVRLIRKTYIEAHPNYKENIYRAALLRFSSHTLSFDKRKGRGECDLPALKYVLISTSILTKQLNAAS